MSEKAILIVDDEAILLISLKQILRLRYGGRYRYETATSGSKGLDCVQRLVEEGVEVVLIISDWLMPGMKGDEFLSRVHTLYPSIKLIMLSGHADESEIERLAGAVGRMAFIRKPWAPERLFEVVESALA